MYPLLIACSQITPQMAILENLDIFKGLILYSPVVNLKLIHQG